MVTCAINKLIRITFMKLSSIALCMKEVSVTLWEF
jgi:hypothetical protein